MRIFDFDPKQYREQYAEQGWIHVPGGVGAEFLRTLTAFVQDHFAEHEVEGRGVHGTKTRMTMTRRLTRPHTRTASSRRCRSACRSIRRIQRSSCTDRAS